MLTVPNFVVERILIIGQHLAKFWAKCSGTFFRIQCTYIRELMLHTLSGIKAVIRGMEGGQVTELWLSWKGWVEVKKFEAALSTFSFPFMINLYLAEKRFESCSAVRRECVCNGRCYCYDSCTKHLVPFFNTVQLWLYCRTWTVVHCTNICLCSMCLFSVENLY